MQALIPTAATFRPAALAPVRQARQGVATAPSRSPAISKQGSTRSTMPQRRLAARPTRRQGAMRVAAASGEALVVGSSGQTAARVVVSLLRAGFKVTAGVDTDIDETREVVQFAKKLEILSAGEAGGLKLAEFNPLDADSVGTVLKRGARVVLVAGDQVSVPDG